PTEILAQQHYMNLSRQLEPLGVKTALLTGSLRPSEKRKILDGLSDGSINIAVGTHALFSEAVEFKNLSLVVVDEQHRFGVLQRSGLTAKAKAPHVLAMTATPIPRTLVMSIYGDLEVSTLNELPKGRKKIKTTALKQSEFKKVFRMIREQVREGRQVYWVCPLIDESERDLHSVNSANEMLKAKLPEMRTKVIHGQLPIDEKAEIMQDFSAGKIDILVSTVVIEVGVDVPNASMIVIQDAGQFGLAQLHQLRGRVGRGEAQSYCVLLENADITETGAERISAMEDISDGFELAERDLIQRGPGEICGTHQHGVTDFRVADLVRDGKILTLARDEAKSILEADPELKTEPELRHEIVRRLGGVLELAATS
ncbi:MAG: DEAD/DEAH box helicase, partial [Synergistaceae bacterium]|nr:DEAD/DEAH box helicase [Synergistaceae bacterium]